MSDEGRGIERNRESEREAGGKQQEIILPSSKRSGEVTSFLS